jgi:tetratricopeptide (TPR) repeat protein
MRADPRATDAALELAALELERGQPRDAADAAASFLEHRSRTRAEAYRLLLRAQRAQDLLEPARRTAQQFADAGFVAEAALARGELEAAAHGPGAGARAIETSGVDVSDPNHEALLRALVEYQVDANRTIAALTAVDRALAVEPDTASLHELRGGVLLRLARTDAAKNAFQAALALDADDARARSGLAQVAFAQGDAKRAIALYDEAAQVSGDDVAPVYAAGQVALASGDASGARRRLETVIRRDPDHAGARNDLAWMLAQSGEDLERALELATRAHEIDPNPDITDTLGYVHLQRGESALAIERFEQALAKRPTSQSMRYRLGLALAQSGDRERAIATLRKALDQGPFPETEAAQRELAQLERQPAGERAP